MAEKVKLTEAALEAKKEELNRLVAIERKEVADRIKEAREFGDISENAEYDAAMDEQEKLEEKIKKLEGIIANAEIIQDYDGSGIVSVGTIVEIKQKGKRTSVEYTIKGAVEADPLAGIISNESPIGKALIGNKIGDKVEVETPDGKVEYKIVGIRPIEE